jgi:hypothetical protein
MVLRSVDGARTGFEQVAVELVDELGAQRQGRHQGKDRADGQDKDG